MKLITQLYIDLEPDLSKTPNYQRLDLFDFESIELTSTIQDSRDIASIFTDFSQQFNIPASNRNNKLLKHFYSLSLLDGFDARIKRRAYIAINGVTFRNGFLRLSETKIKNGNPYSYSLTFFGAMVSLKDILGESELKDLGGLSKYNHTYSENVAFQGFITGLKIDNGTANPSTDRDVIYPAISCNNKWSYKSSASSDPEEYNQGFNVNIFFDNISNATRGISFTQLKPAIRAISIIEAIEAKYSSITFSRDFFSKPEFTELYLLLHNAKGELNNALAIEDDSVVVPLQKTYIITSPEGNNSADFNVVSGDTELRPFVTSRSELDDKEYFLSVSVSSVMPSTGAYTIRLYADGNIVASLTDTTGDSVLGYNLSSKQEKEWNDLKVEIEADAGQLTSYNINLNVETTVTQVDYNGVETQQVVDSDYELLFDETQSIVSEIEITKHIPEITILEFLRGLFKMFNLTAYIEDEIIVVKTLNDFYSSGSDRDMSLEIDTSEINIKRAELYNNINFEFADASTFAVLSQNEELNDNFGNLEYTADDGSLVFDGSKYEIKLPFEKLMYERLSDEDNLDKKGDERPPFGYGWLVDKDENPIKTKPILFYNIHTPCDTTNFPFQLRNAGVFTSYNRPSNILENGSASLHFGAETDNYTSAYNQESLFKRHYEDYVANLFNKTTRIVNYKTVLKLSTLISYKMNDRIIVNGNPFRINSIKTNLNTGVSDLELLTDYDFTEVTVATDETAPTIPTDLQSTSQTTTTITVTWSASSDNIAVTGYKVWKDGVATDVGNVLTYQLTGLTSSLEYEIQVSAYDAAGNESAKSQLIAIETLATVDSTAPTNADADANLTLNYITNSTLDFSWSGFTDNVGVTGYNIYVDSSLEDSIGTETNYQLSGLTASTAYDIQVSAVDEAGNESTLSTVSSFTTRSADYEPPTTPVMNTDFYRLFSTRIVVYWDEATDNTAVTGYKIYVNGVFNVDVGNVTAYNVTGLTSGSLYAIQVLAYDAAGNESLLSNSLNIVTP